MTTYVVTSGCYSDRQVVGAYTTRELAESAAQLAGEDVDILEFETDSVPQHEPGLKLWEVAMHRCGSLALPAYPVSAFDHPENVKTWASCGGWTFTLWARNAEHAVKSANEKRAMLLANQTP